MSWKYLCEWQRSSDLPRSCQDHRLNGHAEDGIYTIFTGVVSNAITNIYCYMSAAPWTVPFTHRFLLLTYFVNYNKYETWEPAEYPLNSNPPPEQTKIDNYDNYHTNVTRGSAVAVIADSTACSSTIGQNNYCVIYRPILTLFTVIAESRPVNKNVNTGAVIRAKRGTDRAGRS